MVSFRALLLEATGLFFLESEIDEFDDIGVGAGPYTFVD